MRPTGVFMRRARLRNLKEGKVQTARAEVFDHNPRDEAERWQDYGFAASPIEGEGLRFEVGGHVFILRMDRTAERPTLAPYEVCIWHKEGHMATLKAGGLIEAQCTLFRVMGNAEVIGNLTVTGNIGAAGTITAPTVIGTTNVIASDVSTKGHIHPVDDVPGFTDPPVGGG